MEAYFNWLQNLPSSVWLSESPSIWGYHFALFLHSLGMALSAGSAFVICLRLLGIAQPLPVSSLRLLFRFFWVGFYLNLVTGSLLFAAAAGITGYVPIYYAKLILILSGLVLSIQIRTFVDGEASDAAIPVRTKMFAAASLVVWAGVITTGRMIAYVQYY